MRMKPMARAGAALVLVTGVYATMSSTEAFGCTDTGVAAVLNHGKPDHKNMIHKAVGDECEDTDYEALRQEVMIIGSEDSRRPLTSEEQRRFAAIGRIEGLNGALLGSASLVLRRDMIVTSAHLFADEGEIKDIFRDSAGNLDLSDLRLVIDGCGSYPLSEIKKYMIRTTIPSSEGHDYAFLQLGSQVCSKVKPLSTAAMTASEVKELMPSEGGSNQLYLVGNYYKCDTIEGGYECLERREGPQVALLSGDSAVGKNPTLNQARDSVKLLDQCHIDRLYRSEQNNLIYTYSCDTTKGASGSGLIATLIEDGKEEDFFVGIHKGSWSGGEENKGVRLGEGFLKDLRNFKAKLK